MLLWNCVSILFHKLQPEYRALIASQLQIDGPLVEFLNFFFETYLSEPKSLPSDLTKTLLNPTELPLSSTQGVAGVRLLASMVISNLTQRAPAIIRGWWDSDCPRRLRQPFSDFVCKYISPLLIEGELRSCHNQRIENDESIVKIKSRFGQAEVLAVYEKDENLQLDLVITLSSSHPLAPAQVLLSRDNQHDCCRSRTASASALMLLAGENGNCL